MKDITYTRLFFIPFVFPFQNEPDCIF